jgi:Zn-dependent protease with chaperone function
MTQPVASSERNFPESGGPLVCVGSSVGYRVSLVVVAAAVVLLPVIYIGLIPVALWAVHFQTEHYPYYIMVGYMRYSNAGRIWSDLQSLLLLAIILLYPAQLLSIIKPLFSLRGGRQKQAVPLDPALQPAAEAFVADICRMVGAPLPERIELDCRLNASVELRGGLGIFRKRTVLRLGLPLVSALSQRQLAGVLAHELGHFTQGFGMRLSYIIRGMNRWLERAVNERDTLDNALEQCASGRAGWSETLAQVAVFAVAVARWMLGGLMLAGQAASCLLLRQMELDADMYEIRLGGSAAFETTTRRLAMLRAALVNANKEAAAMWHLGRHLPENFPAYLLYHESRMPLAMRQAATVEKKEPALFDTHPSDRERVRRAREANEAGMFGDERTATELFAHYDLLAKEVTYFHYVEELGLDLDLGDANLRPTPVLPSADGQ